MKQLIEQAKKNGITNHELQGIINISLQNSFCYVENAKVACSSIKYNLIQLELKTSELRTKKYIEIKAQNLHEPLYGPMLHPFQLNAAILDDVFLHNNFYIFTFVRNPFSRILSAYLDKIAKNKAPKIYIVRDLFKSEDLNEFVSFKNFVKCLYENSKLLHKDKHWRPQYANLLLPVIQYDFIGKLENFDFDFNKVAAYINKEDINNIENYTPHATSADEKILEFYDDLTIKMVAEMYAKDFETFGYKKTI